MKSVLVFPGAFNPPTIAHIETAYFALQKTQRQQVIFVPSKQTYIQNDQKKDFAFSDEQRLSFLNQIAINNRWLLVSDYEIQSSQQPRTYETLTYLKNTGYDCKLLIGFDKLVELETAWKHVTEIMREFGIVCLSRNGSDPLTYMQNDAFLKPFIPYVQIVKTGGKYQHIASRTIRRDLLTMKNTWQEMRNSLPKELNAAMMEYIQGGGQ